MANIAPLENLVITDSDVDWSTRVMGLPENAFCGADGTDPRREVLKDMTSIDVSACPGSGKTTLLIAKLAIIAKKWSFRTKGVCVLSHTNAARDEIEKRLGHSAVGRSLLEYPHFIGTIHGFVDQFLALPWLRSKGYPIKMVDTEICLLKRWNSLPYGARIYLEKNGHFPSILSIKTPDFGLGQVRCGKGRILGETTATYSSMQEACRLATEQGFFCFDEMFMWADELISVCPDIISAIRSRFPLLLIDETQDNSEPQSRILNRIFQSGGSPVIRQRFGDENQAIYDFSGAPEALTDKFPLVTRTRELPNSHRFCPSIAKLTGPLGLNANTCTLIGEGPKGRDIPHLQGATKNTIFLFDDTTIKNVLDEFGRLVFNTFPRELLQKGVFKAVGQVHRDGGDTNKPRNVKHYWPEYDPELCSKEPRPDSFLKYIYSGMGAAQLKMEANPLVEKIAEGILRLAGMAKDFSYSGKRSHSHQHILRCLDGHPETINNYTRIVHEWVVKGKMPNKDAWQDGFSKKIREIAGRIANDPLPDGRANHFLRWKELETEALPEARSPKFKDNIYCYEENGKIVLIRVGSIHSVKGETHNATLVMETFWHNHNMESLLDWLCAGKCGHSSTGVRNINRLKIHYVAMTRPSHLLCLAMKRSSLENDNGKLKKEILDKLSDQGWNIALIH